MLAGRVSERELNLAPPPGTLNLVPGGELDAVLVTSSRPGSRLIQLMEERNLGDP